MGDQKEMKVKMYTQSMVFLVDAVCSVGVCAGLSGLLLVHELDEANCTPGCGAADVEDGSNVRANADAERGPRW
jgi:hypothetical protein